MTCYHNWKQKSSHKFLWSWVIHMTRNNFIAFTHQQLSNEWAVLLLLLLFARNQQIPPFCQESCQRQGGMIWSIKRRKARNDMKEIFIFYWRRVLCLPMLPTTAMFWRIPVPRFPNIKYTLWLQNVVLHFLNMQEVITEHSVSLGHGNQCGGSSSISVVCKCNQSHSESLSTYCHAGSIYTIFTMPFGHFPLLPIQFWKDDED